MSEGPTPLSLPTLLQWYQGSCGMMLLNTGLLQHIRNHPGTIEEISVATSLHSRYVQEWANGCACCGLLIYDATKKIFSMAPETAECLSAAPETELLRLSFQASPSVVECFKNGGGVPYSQYPGFAKVEADITCQDTIDKLEEGSFKILDIGCGTGHCSNVLAKRFPKSHFYGVDLSEEAILFAKKEASDLGLPNATFWCADLTALPSEIAEALKSVDLVTSFMVLHDLSFPGKVLKEICEVLPTGGRILILENKASPLLEENMKGATSTFYYTVSLLHCMTQSLAGSHEGCEGAGLGTMVPSSTVRDLLAEAGFQSTTENFIPSRPHKCVYISTK